MRIGVIGAGQLGGTLARWCAESGHEVAVTSRHPERLRAEMDGDGAPLRVMPIPEAAAFGDVVIFSPNWSSAREAIDMTRDVLADKVVIDATNPEPDGEPGPGGLAGIGMPGGLSGLETLIEWAPEAHWAKAFNTMSTEVLSRRRGHDPLLTEYVCTDQLDAREATVRIIRDLGFAPFYVGGPHAALLTETGGPLRMLEVDVQYATDALAEALVTLH
ncbi:NAD(P)-binding domain-containing protein [Actinoplanes hulinensis]|uniref:NAD(P)-binding domain-containing protein n=1 Tax=Actinoplanes hulinensis TaxID=1144547 RepID=A0ABS7BG37_9ACTN|nr:NAD(P)-binding domain-containing protein [Actinoplanes hulinensis]MBW6439855.1 NAD(P)-binding domain-containing protein [Actinoplanes hulinensis]